MCGKEAKLQQSHIIPKFVYKRIRSCNNSRFRKLDDITKIMQDGEKREMLCHDCEELFSSFEVKFSRGFLDEYLKNDKVPKIKEGWLDNYLLSVTWGILWDDLYRLNSHNDHYSRGIFEDFCSDLGKYLLQLTPGSNAKPPKIFTNKMYKLSQLTKNEGILKMGEGAMFGYSVFFGKTKTASVIVYYAGIVYVTEYTFDKEKYVFLGDRNIFLFKKMLKKAEIKDEVQIEFVEMAKQCKDNITPELRQSIEKYYANKKA